MIATLALERIETRQKRLVGGKALVLAQLIKAVDEGKRRIANRGTMDAAAFTLDND